MVPLVEKVSLEPCGALIMSEGIMEHLMKLSCQAVAATEVVQTLYQTKFAVKQKTKTT